MFAWLTNEINCEFKTVKLFNECNSLINCLQNNPNDLQQLEISDESFFLVINLITRKWLRNLPTSEDELMKCQYLIDIVRNKVYPPEVQILPPAGEANGIKGEIIIAMEKRMEKEMANLIPSDFINFITGMQSKRLQIHLKNETPKGVIETLLKLDDPDVELIVVDWKIFSAQSTSRDNLKILKENLTLFAKAGIVAQLKDSSCSHLLLVSSPCEKLHQYMKSNDWQFNINGETIKITVRPSYKSCYECHHVYSGYHAKCYAKK